MNKKQYVFYGFDKIGYELPARITTFRKEFDIIFPKYDDNNVDWAKTEGLIIPNGIFEDYNSVLKKFHFDESLLLEIEKKATNLISEGKWFCILAASKFYVDHKNTDLSKKIIKGFSYKVKPIETPFQILETPYDQFRKYMKNYGTVKNVFKYKGNNKSSITIIAGDREDYDQLIAFEHNCKLFVLPFHSAKKEESDLMDTSKIILEAICDYISVKKKELPDWVNEFKFNDEQVLEEKRKNLQQDLNQVDSEIAAWKEYKLVLTTKSENLREIIIKVFEEFFQFEIDPIDNHIEDFKIKESSNILAFCEVKGTKKGVKREYVNQVDSHRERNDIETSVPGILIINNQMALNSLQKRNETEITGEHITRAVNSNVLIIRTIDLLNFMKLYEKESKGDRRKKMQNYLNKGGGWLKVDDKKIELISKVPA